MDEHDRLTRAFVEKGNFYPVVRKARHGPTIITAAPEAPVSAIPPRAGGVLLSRSKTRCVMRSAAALHEAQKPISANAAQISHIARSKVVAVSTMAARPRSFMIARVLPPLAAESRASRAMSCGSSATARLSSAACVSGLGLDASGIFRKLDEAAGLLDFHRLARGPHRQDRIEPSAAARRLDQRKADRAPAP